MSRRGWSILVAVAVLLSAWSWYTFTYPRFAVIDLSVSRDKALQTARQYVIDHDKVNLDGYLSAIIFSFDANADRYLQKSLGYDGEEKFIQEHDLDLFVWMVRFMKEGQKEEFRVAVSSKTGQVISYGRLLEDTAARDKTDETAAQRVAEEFLKSQFRLDFNKYDFHSKSIDKYDNRQEYYFLWEKKNVFVRWSDDADSGGARLLTSVRVSGNDVINYSRQYLTPPDQFSRYMDRMRESGRNLQMFSSVVTMALLIWAVFVVARSNNHFAMHISKPFYIKLTLALFGLFVLSGLNNGQLYINSYQTTLPFAPYMTRQIIADLISRFFIIVCFIIPCLAGELLHFEVFPKRPKGSFFHYLSTTFFSRDVAGSIGWGYIFAVILIGLQALIFDLGYRYFDVWVEQTRLNQLSSSYFPFLAALIIGLHASLAEETFYRMYTMSIAKKWVNNLVVACLFSSLVWGMGHTGYLVFPFWFRGVEVTILGIIMAFIYLRFGIITIVVAHFMFDAFWGSSSFIFGRGSAMNFWMSIAILLLPLAWAVVAYLKNAPVVFKNLQWRLNPNQKFNLDVLKSYIANQRVEPSFSAGDLRARLVKNGWDLAVIDVAFKQLEIPIPGENHWHSA